MKRAELARIFRRALRELDLATCVARALPQAPSVRAAPVRVIAIGKAAPAMAAGALARWGSRIEECLVIAPDETNVDVLRREARRSRLNDRVVVMRAGHPLPDARSVRAGLACLDFVRTEKRCTVLVLVSGGASALACAPSSGVTLGTKRAITRAMLASGARVQDLNVVRKHLSRIKGGGLARAAGANRVITLVASDVIGGTLADVGSGPTIADASSVSDARRLLRRFAPAYADVPFARSPALAKDAPRRFAKTVLSPDDLARTMARLLRAKGLVVRILAPSQAPVEELAAEYVAIARRASSGSGRASRGRAFVRVAEPSINVPPRAGRGGRSTHVAALVGRDVADANHGRSLDLLFAAFGSDGVDGTSGTGGAIVDRHFAAHIATALGPRALDRALGRFDTGPLHVRVGTALGSKPTGQNFADLHVLVLGS